MTTPLHIEHATLADLPAIRDAYAYGREMQQRVGSTLWPEFDDASIVSQIASKQLHRVRADGGELAGVFTAATSDAAIWGERERGAHVYLHRIARARSWRGRGLVDAIFAWTAMHCRATGREGIRMDTWASNEPLIAFYVSCGFTLLGTTRIGVDPRLPPHYHNGEFALLERAVTPPAHIDTPRLILRRWSPDDADALQPLLVANAAHIGPWIPPHISTPAPTDELGTRLRGFADDFASGIRFRYAIVTRDDTRIVGEADLFPRNASGRVMLDDADRAEIGYWLDASATGRGFATEATQALLAVARALPQMTLAEIRCDAANLRSALVPARLGFELETTEGTTQVWRLELRSDPGAHQM